MPSHNFTLAWSRSGESISKTVTVTADSEYNADIPLTASQADEQVAATLDVSEIKSIFISSDVDVTLETNSSSAPDETLSITADEPFVWRTGSGVVNPLETDITALYLTNGDATAGTVKIRILYDGTP